MNIKIWFLLLLAAGVVVPALSATAISKTSEGRKALLEELSRACVVGSKDRDPKKVQVECECLIRYHSAATEDRYLKVVVDAYTGRQSFDSPKIADEISIVLNNDADALEKCERDPNWGRHWAPRKNKKQGDHR